MARRIPARRPVTRTRAASRGDDAGPYLVVLDPARPPDGGPEQLGFKAWNLWRMAHAGLPVPPALVLTTAACHAVQRRSDKGRARIAAALAAGIAQLAERTGSSLGEVRRPLVLSVRSGAPVSMPGMLDTVLNVGLNDVTVRALTRQRGHPRLAWDCYRRLIESYTAVVTDCDPAAFAALARTACAQAGVSAVRELDALALRDLVQDYLETYRALTGEHFPQDPAVQLRAALQAVFDSWNGARAREYRRQNGISDQLGTAATVQVMVFGNSGGTSGSGVGFTRNPATGARELYIDFLFDAQGEDVVSGRYSLVGQSQLEALLPEIGARLRAVSESLERQFGDMQDFEFTIENGELHLLQTRNGKRTPWTACHIATDLVTEGLCTPAQALERLRDIDPAAVVRRRAAPGAGVQPLARATPSSLGVATGPIALDSAAAARARSAGSACILVRADTSTEDIAGLADCAGVLTATGGRTAHAAVVARQMDKVCLVDCPGLTIDLAARSVQLGDCRLAEGEVITLDGETGSIYAGAIPTRAERPTRALAAIARWRRAAARPGAA